MAVTLDSRLPFHLSRGDQERETSRLSLLDTADASTTNVIRGRQIVIPFHRVE